MVTKNYVKQAMAEFLGMLMAQNAASAESKFLSLDGTVSIYLWSHYHYSYSVAQ